jgi:hypothetical protein
MVVNTWSNFVIGTAPAHTVVALPATFWGTEKKYAPPVGEEEICSIVWHGVRPSPGLHPEVSDP